METIALGQSGVVVPALGIGTWAWGDKLFWGYGKEYGEQQLREAFQEAIAAGVNFFDTAEIYGFGESESLLGRFMKETGASVHIATKYFPLPWRFSASAVADTLTASLKRLQVPSVDLYQVHWPLEFFMGQPTLMDALADAVKQGRIRAIGVSNYSAEKMRQAHELLSKRGVPLAVNQVQYSLIHRNIEANGILDTARELNIAILAYSPLSQGLLTGKYLPGQPKPSSGARQIDPRFSEAGLTKLAPVINTLKDLAEKYERTPAQVALNWLIAQGNVIPIPGAKNANHARQNAGALGWSLSEADVATLSQVTASYI